MLKDRLRLLRESMNLTQKEFANNFNMSDARYNQYETGKRQPDYESLKTFAQFYSVSIDYILGVTDIGDPYPFCLNTMPLSADENILIENYRNLSNDGINYINNQMEIAVQLYKKDSKSSPVEEQA